MARAAPAAALLLLAPPAAAIGDDDTMLANEFCGTYYTGTGDCAALRAQVRANHSRAVPTLEVGDPSKPAMLMLHGWPDDSAIWVNQMEYFCAPPNGKFFCVAPSWYNYHPDLPTRPKSDLFYDTQIDAWRAVAVAMGLSNITLVMHDFGCTVGYMFAWKYPELVSRIVTMDIANEPGGVYPPPGGFAALPAYQQTNINAYNAGDDAQMRKNSATAPCAECSFVQARIGWNYNAFIAYNGTKDEFHARLSPIPKSEWKFAFSPDFPDGIPLLFLYGKCEIDTGCKGCPIPICIPRVSKFWSQNWLDWVAARAGSAAVGIDGVGHWMPDRGSANTNAAMAAWL